MLPFYIALYVVGMLLGLGAKIVFDVQLHGLARVSSLGWSC